MANFKYKQLADWIKEQIRDQTYTAGMKLPTEAEFSEQFSLSRHTVRQAIACLEEEGYVYCVQGSGSYVQEKAEEKITERTQPLTTPNSKVIGFMLVDNRSYIFPEIIRGASDYLRERGYLLNVMFTGHDFRGERQALEVLMASSPAGLLIEPANSGIISENAALYREVVKRIPTIALHLDHSDFCPVVSLNDREGGRMVGEYLIGQGHKKIGTIFCFDESTGHMRYRGLLDALDTHDLMHSDEWEIWTQRSKADDIFKPEGCYRLKKLIRNVTAIVCHNDPIAHELIAYLRSEGVRVPEDISVIGYDDSFYATLDTPITTVVHPKAEYGRKAAQAILELIESPETFDEKKYQVKPELVLRDSTAAPKLGGYS